MARIVRTGKRKNITWRPVEGQSSKYECYSAVVYKNIFNCWNFNAKIGSRGKRGVCNVFSCRTMREAMSYVNHRAELAAIEEEKNHGNQIQG